MITSQLSACEKMFLVQLRTQEALFAQPAFLVRCYSSGTTGLSSLLYPALEDKSDQCHMLLHILIPLCLSLLGMRKGLVLS